jgi:hypothetical protein
MNCYDGFYNNCYMNPKMPSMPGIYPAQNIQTMDLEAMYPQVYYKVYPYVKNYCDMVGIKHGMMFSPTKEQMDMMVDNIYNQVQPMVDMPEDEMKDMENTRPIVFGPAVFGGRRFLRDIIGILLIQELLNRRPYGYGGAGFFPGFYY